MNYLVLANKENSIKKSFFKYLHLIKVFNAFGEEILVEEKTYNAFLQLKTYLESEEIYIDITSAYEEFNPQEEVVLPKYEHCTGLALDITLKIDNKYIRDNKDLFNYDVLFRRIHDNLSKFGFILRYPKGKETITECNYTPWHLRYVGVICSKIISNYDLCLEEYLHSFGAILVVNKDSGMTSFDVVNEVRHILGIKKVGHTGTLDPLAKGVLVLTIGKYTKLSEDLSALDKEYIASVKIGITTDTLDITGNILEKNNNTVANLKSLLSSFQKRYVQEVPLYSAVKVNGKKLYEYARRGEEVALPSKEVEIKSIELLKEEEQSFTFKTTVSKGTYIRSLIRDMARDSNTLMTMTDLERTRQGDFLLKDSFTLNDIKNGNFTMKSILDVGDYKVIDINDDLYKKVDNGVALPNDFGIQDKIIFRYKGSLIAIYKVQGDKVKMYKKLI